MMTPAAVAVAALGCTVIARRRVGRGARGRGWGLGESLRVGWIQRRGWVNCAVIWTLNSSQD